jgi:hypothetical protein
MSNVIFLLVVVLFPALAGLIAQAIAKTCSTNAITDGYYGRPLMRAEVYSMRVASRKTRVVGTIVPVIASILTFMGVAEIMPTNEMFTGKVYDTFVEMIYMWAFMAGMFTATCAAFLWEINYDNTRRTDLVTDMYKDEQATIDEQKAIEDALRKDMLNANSVEYNERIEAELELAAELGIEYALLSYGAQDYVDRYKSKYTTHKDKHQVAVQYTLAAARAEQEHLERVRVQYFLSQQA